MGGSLSTHTPGPWAVFADPSNENWLTGRTIYSVSEHSRIADVTVLRNNDQAFADARLIAAAPDLLDALQFLFAEYKALADSGDAGRWRLEDMPEGKTALAAIAKAKGEEA